MQNFNKSVGVLALLSCHISIEAIAFGQEM
jgi:hypothetical protein